MEKSPGAFRTISEVADWLGVPAHVLRFWESRFAQVKPVKRAGGRRYYRPNDMLLLGGIRKLLHDEGMTIRGVQKLLREEGVKHVAGFSHGLEMGVEGEGAIEIDAEPDDADNVVALAPEPAVPEDEDETEALFAASLDETQEDAAAPVVAADIPDDPADPPPEAAASHPVPDITHVVGRLRQIAGKRRARPDMAELAPHYDRMLKLRDRMNRTD